MKLSKKLFKLIVQEFFPNAEFSDSSVQFAITEAKVNNDYSILLSETMKAYIRKVNLAQISVAVEEEEDLKKLLELFKSNPMSIEFSEGLHT